MKYWSAIIRGVRRTRHGLCGTAVTTSPDGQPVTKLLIVTEADQLDQKDRQRFRWGGGRALADTPT
jgi:hypothetical protein